MSRIISWTRGGEIGEEETRRGDNDVIAVWYRRVVVSINCNDELIVWQELRDAPGRFAYREKHSLRIPFVTKS